MKYLNRNNYWPTFIRTFSLDCLIPFWRDIGLSQNLSEKHQINKIAKETFLKLQMEGSSEINKLSSKKTFMIFFERVSHQCDKNVALTLYKWYVNDFCNESTSAAETGLMTALISLVKLYPTELPLKIKESTLKEIFCKISLFLSTTTKREKKIHELKKKSQTLWDSNIFKLSQEGTSPLDVISIMIFHNNFKNFWSELAGILSEQEKKELLRYYKTISKEMNIPKAYVKLPKYVYP